MDNYGVIGNPIENSKSPLIYQMFAENTTQKIQYSSILGEMNNIEKALKEFQSQGGKGLNVALPFKRKAFSVMDVLSDRAQKCEAINMITFSEEGLVGDNTDGVGLVRDITVNKKTPIAKKRILILGTGCSVRGVLHSILSEEPLEVIISNRNENKAFELAEDFADLGRVQACPLSLLENNSFDVVINGTSASLQEEMLDLPGSILTSNALCYDMAYGRGVTSFIRWAMEQGAKQCADGLGMLVEQAAESFYIWRKKRPDTTKVLKVLINEESRAEII